MKRKYKINRAIEEQEVTLEDICLEGVKSKPDVDVSYLKMSKPVYFLLVSMIILVVIVLFGRSYSLQIVQGQELNKEAENNTTKVKKIIPSRGIIFDRNDTPLVQNKPSFDVAIIPAYFNRSDKETRDEKVIYLAKTLNMKKSDILDKIDGSNYYSSFPILLKKHIDHEDAVALRVKATDLSGIEVITTNIREYLDVPYMSHIIGYLGKIDEDDIEEYPEYLMTDYIGKVGVEESYEKELKGEYGEILVEIDSKGNEKKEISNKEAVTGNELVLSIDKDLQVASYDFLEKKVLEEQLRYEEEQIEEKGPEAGSVIVMDSETGSLLTLVSYPSYNNNVFSPAADSDEALRAARKELLSVEENPPMFYRAIAGKYASGSVIKPLVGLAALEEGLISQFTKLKDYGGSIIVGKNDNEYRDSHIHPALSLNIVDAISESSNVFFYQLGGGLSEDEYERFKGLGATKLTEHYHRYKLGKVTGLDIEGENKGLVPNPEWKKAYKEEIWYLGDTYNIAIGQGDLLVTPLQVANYTAMIANDGIVNKPRLVNLIRRSDDDITDLNQNIEGERLASQENVELIQEGMRQAAKIGTGRSFANLPINIHSKTGTAQSPGGEKTQPHSWVTSFADIGNKRLVVTVMIENGGYGSEAAIPVAKEVYQWLIENY